MAVPLLPLLSPSGVHFESRIGVSARRTNLNLSLFPNESEVRALSLSLVSIIILIKN